MAWNWLHSKSSDVKRFDNIIKGKKGFQSVVKEDSYRSVAKFLGKNGKAISYETVRNYLQAHFYLDKSIDEQINKSKNMIKIYKRKKNY